jgi:hypothetical protein
MGGINIISVSKMRKNYMKALKISYNLGKMVN